MSSTNQDESLEEFSLSPVDVPCTKDDGNVTELQLSPEESVCGLEKTEEHIQAAVEEGETEVQQERTLRKSERKGAKSQKVIEREEEQGREE